jgi:hypothetical protein
MSSRWPAKLIGHRTEEKDRKHMSCTFWSVSPSGKRNIQSFELGGQLTGLTNIT